MLVNKLDYLYRKLVVKSREQHNETVDISDDDYEKYYNAESGQDNPIPGSDIPIPAEDEPEHNYSKDYLTFEALEDNCKIIFLGNFIKEIKYSLNNDLTWNTLHNNEFIILNNHEIIHFYNENDSVRYDGDTMDPTYGYCHFYSKNKFNVYGNILSLYNFNKNLLWYIFAGLFKNCINLIDASNLLLSTTLVSSCYQEMFYGCTNLTTAPKLPATTLASYCYKSMFYGCTNLTTAPKLPATTLAIQCYTNMFYGCTSLASAPELPATILLPQCYYSMFYGCKSLNYIKMLASNISASGCLNYYIEGVLSIGTFIKLQGIEFPIGESGIPKGWTVKELDPDTGEIVNEYIAE